jgi:hypothetical protein
MFSPKTPAQRNLPMEIQRNGSNPSVKGAAGSVRADTRFAARAPASGAIAEAHDGKVVDWMGDGAQLRGWE